MIRTALTCLLCALVYLGHAQNPLHMGSARFSDGPRPTYTSELLGTDVRTVTRFWEAELKNISIKVTNKKELVGNAARIPAVSPDTMLVRVKVEQARSGSPVNVHIAGRTINGDISAASVQKEQEAFRSYVEQRMLALRQQLGMQAIADARKEQERLESKLHGLEREQQRSTEQLARTREKLAASQAGQEPRAADVKRTADAITEAQRAHDAAPSEALAKAVKSAQNEHKKAQDQVRKAESAETALAKRIAELEWAIKKAQDDQTAERKAIDTQKTLVLRLEQDLQRLR